MKINEVIEQSLSHPAWTSERLDGFNVQIRIIKSLAKNCALIDQEYKAKNNSLLIDKTS
jgi:hypothetical protein